MHTLNLARLACTVLKFAVTSHFSAILRISASANKLHIALEKHAAANVQFNNIWLTLQADCIGNQVWSEQCCASPSAYT